MVLARQHEIRMLAQGKSMGQQKGDMYGGAKLAAMDAFKGQDQEMKPLCPFFTPEEMAECRLKG